MAELHGISCHPFLLSVLIIEGVGGMGGGAGWDGRWQKLSFGTPMTPIQWSMTHQWATQTVGANPSPHCSIGILHGCYCSSCDFGESAKCPSEK